MVIRGAPDGRVMVGSPPRRSTSPPPHEACNGASSATKTKHELRMSILLESENPHEVVGDGRHHVAIRCADHLVAAQRRGAVNGVATARGVRARGLVDLA